METALLKNRWLALFSKTDTNIANSLFRYLMNSYSESHRYYHTLSHISACLKEYDEVKKKINDPFSVELALWFHDIIYSQKRSDNEEKSSNYVASTLPQAGIEKERVQRVCKLIEITKHPSQPKTLEEMYIVDIDLSILGAPRETYQHYSNQIRQEYSHVPEPLYSHVRKKVLNTFLVSENLYYTEHFQNKYELSAKKNIQSEILRIECK